MVTITATVSGNNVTFQVTYSFLDAGLPNTWGVYVYGKVNRNLGSGPDPNYPYYVEEFHGTDTSTVTRTEATDSYVAVLALTGYGQVDYTLFTVATCQPPGGVQRYCGADGKTLYVWNTISCVYDSQVCQSPNTVCQNGFCVAPACQPPGGVQRYCQDASTVCVWNQVDCTYNCSACSTNVCQNGMCATPGGGTGYNCSGAPNYQCTQAPAGTTGQYPTSTDCTNACKAGGGGTSGCVPACTSSQICLNAIGLGCQPKIYVYGAVAGFFALMMLR